MLDEDIDKEEILRSHLTNDFKGEVIELIRRQIRNLKERILVLCIFNIV